MTPKPSAADRRWQALRRWLREWKRLELPRGPHERVLTEVLAEMTRLSRRRGWKP